MISPLARLSPGSASERDALIAEIHAAFGEVTRGNGYSWNEGVALDNYGTPEECETARLTDKDTRWQELIDDPPWEPFHGIGGFSFIEELGFRYYLPPTMIRFLNGHGTEWYDGHLRGVINSLVDALSGRWSPAQLGAIARFMSFMARHDLTENRRAWRKGFAQRWAKHLRQA